MSFYSKFLVSLSSFILFSSVSLFAKGVETEPAYCDLKKFQQSEIPSGVKGGLERAHVYRLGTIKVVGLAVGNSDTSSVTQLSQKHSATNSSEGYCTWYFNDGNSEASGAFNYQPLPRPNKDKDVDYYIKTVGPSFSKSAPSFVSCASNRGYLAMGCDGMQHRGPTIFGMLLAYSGCSPQNAIKIANTIWGLNGIKESIRLSAATKAYQLGQSEPTESEKLRNTLSGFR